MFLAACRDFNDVSIDIYVISIFFIWSFEVCDNPLVYSLREEINPFSNIIDIVGSP